MYNERNDRYHWYFEVDWASKKVPEKEILRWGTRVIFKSHSIKLRLLVAIIPYLHREFPPGFSAHRDLEPVWLIQRPRVSLGNPFNTTEGLIHETGFAVFPVSRMLRGTGKY